MRYLTGAADSLREPFGAMSAPGTLRHTHLVRLSQLHKMLVSFCNADLSTRSFVPRTS